MYSVKSQSPDEILAELSIEHRARSGNAPDGPRSDVTDRKCGGESYPWFPANKAWQVEVEGFVLNVLLDRVVAILDSLTCGGCGWTTLIHCLAYRGV
jgi:hypothetical protein